MSYDSDPPWAAQGEPDGIDQVPLAGLLQLHELRGLVAKLSCPGFAPPPRLVFAIEPTRMPALAEAVLRIMEAEVSMSMVTSAGVPKTIGVIRLGTDLDLELVGLPTDDTFSPLWPLTLQGAVAVVRLKGAESSALAACCEAASVKLLDAEKLWGDVEFDEPAHVATLMQSALEAASG